MGQPRALATLFLTEMWERFSYYGMRAILVLYLIAPPDGADTAGAGTGFHSLPVAAAIYGAYSSLIYLLPIAGGWVADRLTGPRRAVLFGRHRHRGRALHDGGSGRDHVLARPRRGRRRHRSAQAQHLRDRR